MAFKRFIEFLEELFTQKGNESVLRYRSRDHKYRYIKGYENMDGEPTLKTVNGESVKGSGDISVMVPVVEVEGLTPEQELAPCTFYKFGSITSLSLTLGEPISDVLNVYSFSFTAGDGFDPSTDITWPDGVLLNAEIKMETGDECEVSIRDNRATFTVWSIPAADPTDD